MGEKFLELDPAWADDERLGAGECPPEGRETKGGRRASGFDLQNPNTALKAVQGRSALQSASRENEGSIVLP
jgi:sensor histidine kinase YesM